MSDNKEVFIGDEVAIEEEYLASEGTYAKDGIVYASQIGTLILDDEECMAKVVSPNPPNILKPGDIVYAKVSDIRKTMATADVLCKDGTERRIGSETYATIHVSKISPGYTDDVSKELSNGDGSETFPPAHHQGRPPRGHPLTVRKMQDRARQEEQGPLLSQVRAHDAQEARGRLR